VLEYAAQGILQIDAEVAENSHDLTGNPEQALRFSGSWWKPSFLEYSC